jgi:hypothetical protein
MNTEVKETKIVADVTGIKKGNTAMRVSPKPNPVKPWRMLARRTMVTTRMLSTMSA